MKNRRNLIIVLILSLGPKAIICRIENRPVYLETAIEIDQSLPITLCHSLVAIVNCVDRMDVGFPTTDPSKSNEKIDR